METTWTHCDNPFTNRIQRTARLQTQLEQMASKIDSGDARRFEKVQERFNRSVDKLMWKNTENIQPGDKVFLRIERKDEKETRKILHHSLKVLFQYYVLIESLRQLSSNGLTNLWKTFHEAKSLLPQKMTKMHATKRIQSPYKLKPPLATNPQRKVPTSSMLATLHQRTIMKNWRNIQKSLKVLLIRQTYNFKLNAKTIHTHKRRRG